MQPIDSVHAAERVVRYAIEAIQSTEPEPGYEEERAAQREREAAASEQSLVTPQPYLWASNST